MAGDVRGAKFLDDRCRPQHASSTSGRSQRTADDHQLVSKLRRLRGVRAAFPARHARNVPLLFPV